MRLTEVFGNTSYSDINVFNFNFNIGNFCFVSIWHGIRTGGKFYIKVSHFAGPLLLTYGNVYVILVWSGYN